MKKILCLIDRLGFGGAERQMIGLAYFLKQQNYDVDLVTYDKHDFSEQVESECGFRVKCLSPRSNKLSKFMAVRNIIKNNGYDVVVAYKNGPTSIACMLKVIGGRFRLIVSERNTTQRLTLKSKAKFWLYRWADYIVPNARTQTDFISNRYPCLANKTITINNFTDTKAFCPKEISPPNNPIIILTVARVAAQKNVMRYIDVAKKVKDVGLNVIFRWYGNIQHGQEEYGNQCSKRVKELDLADVFEFHPASTEIVKRYQECDIFCLPSLYEGYPNVICEAMSCGKPILCSRICDNPYIVEENRNGMMFDPTDIEDIFRAVYHMCEKTGNQRSVLGNCSRDIAEKKFSSEIFVNKYIRLIEEG